jgi:alpha-L-arabinofuranosidase
VNGPDIKSENDFDKNTVKITERSLTAEARSLHCSFAPHSYTMLKLNMA